MPQRVSAGIVVYRMREGEMQVFLAHPGGPYFVNRDEGVWTIPKGEIEPGEDYLVTALREFQEETGKALDPSAEYISLGSIRQKGGKIVHAWGVAGDWDDSVPICSNTFQCEWPPRSRRMQTFPEMDVGRFLSLAEARRKIKETQIPLLDRLEATVKGSV